MNTRFNYPFLFLLLTFLVNVTASAQNEAEKERKLRVKNRIKETYILNHAILNGSATSDSTLSDHIVFDESGYPIEDIRYDKSGNVFYTFKLDYNENHHNIQQTGFNKNDSLSTLVICEYDKKGNRTEFKRTNFEEQSLHHHKYIYNNQNQCTEVFVLKRNIFQLWQKYFYNNNGTFHKITRYSDGELVATTEFGYDKNGNLLTVYENRSWTKKLIIQNKYNELNQLIQRDYVHKKIYPLVEDPLIPVEAKTTIAYSYDTEGNIAEESISEEGILTKVLRYQYIKR